MSDRLRSFLIELAQNPQRLDEFNRPLQMMEAAGLSKEEKEALQSGDPDRLRELVGPPDHKPPIICHVIYFKNDFKL